MFETTLHPKRLSPHFTRKEMACRHCGEEYDWPEFMVRLEMMRSAVKAPLRILSGHRCALHNARVGGAPLSQHLKLAADIALDRHKPAALLVAAKEAGFTGFGLYQSFLHIDLGRRRQWYSGEHTRLIWQI